jgi:hypothetical protein
MTLKLERIVNLGRRGRWMIRMMCMFGRNLIWKRAIRAVTCEFLPPASACPLASRR